MSQAFVREGYDQELEDIGPSIRALTLFLTRENNGIGVREISHLSTPEGREVYGMSNGLSYSKNSSGKWLVI